MGVQRSSFFYVKVQPYLVYYVDRGAPRSYDCFPISPVESIDCTTSCSSSSSSTSPDSMIGSEQFFPSLPCPHQNHDRFLPIHDPWAHHCFPLPTTTMTHRP
eukprot:347197_1